MSQIKVYDIACAADNRYAVLAAVMLKSVELSSGKGVRFRVWFLDNGLSASRKSMITDSLDSAKMEVQFIVLRPHHIELLSQIRNGKKLTAYHRLFIPDLVSGQVRRLLYLDCDIVVSGDLSELMELPLEEDAVVACARDTNAWTVGCDWGGGIPNWASLGMQRDDPYFNSGVLLLDVPKWISLGIAEKVIQCTLDNVEHIMWLDQYGLNVVLANKWREIAGHWNAYPDKGVDSPKIIHFVSRKPNQADYRGRYQDLFFSILDQTAWRGKRPVNLAWTGWLPKKIAGHLKWVLSPW